MTPRRWEKLRRFADYAQFERIALSCVLVILSVISVYAIVALMIKLSDDFTLGEAFLEKAALQDTFGAILTILIVLEFNHSVYVALTHKAGAIQVRTVILLTVLVITRKLMLQDFNAMTTQTFLGFGALLLALGVIYWLISNADRSHAAAEAEAKKQKPGYTA
ncbi:MAG TPA: phosphate-starvation-inducible PsiE family protein [Xanthobacteraceae bacterium]|jgi:uncharacterized membrane protein (DUF373 family)|nr:phosphate-starvation-inducible PsiE family protein [Xanthobacteraceae bacterium]